MKNQLPLGLQWLTPDIGVTSKDVETD